MPVFVRLDLFLQTTETARTLTNVSFTRTEDPARRMLSASIA